MNGGGHVAGINAVIAGTVLAGHELAQSVQKIGVVEVPGEHAGWLALQAGIALSVDAVLIPEIPQGQGGNRV